MEAYTSAAKHQRKGRTRSEGRHSPLPIELSSLQRFAAVQLLFLIPRLYQSGLQSIPPVLSFRNLFQKIKLFAF